MHGCPEEIYKQFGITSHVEIEFINTKKILVDFSENGWESKIIEGVKYITILESPAMKGSLEIETVASSESTALQNFKKITILD